MVKKNFVFFKSTTFSEKLTLYLSKTNSHSNLFFFQLDTTVFNGRVRMTKNSSRSCQFKNKKVEIDKKTKLKFNERKLQKKIKINNFLSVTDNN